MANFNKVILVGNLTRDPELRYTPKGTALASFGLAVNRVWRDEAGQSKEEVTFVDIEAWGRQAETIGQYMKKGRPVLVEGRLRLDSWEDKQTKQKRSRLVVVVEGFQFLGSGGQSAAEEAGSAAPAANPVVRAQPAAPAPPESPGNAAVPAAPASPRPPASEASPAEDDVPF